MAAARLIRHREDAYAGRTMGEQAMGLQTVDRRRVVPPAAGLLLALAGSAGSDGQTVAGVPVPSEWCRATADELGLSRITGQEVLRMLVTRLLTDPTMASQSMGDSR
jgi:hypothetical protein